MPFPLCFLQDSNLITGETRGRAELRELQMERAKALITPLKPTPEPIGYMSQLIPCIRIRFLLFVDEDIPVKWSYSGFKKDFTKEL